MNPTYEPEAIEARWYSTWEDAGAFRPEINPDGPPFAIVIPPPNVTGVLHMGHALNMSIQDAIIRRKRMQGFAALWLPGMDHAGIATQNVVERQLATEGLTRHDLGRDRFEEQAWVWKERSGGQIVNQIRTMGFSTDWSRERFTLDGGLSAAVREVFVTLYEQDVIYRGNRIINWCPRCHTAISDIEVDHKDETGELVYIRYPFVDGDGGIVVATTRPETMLGDMGVAVHPDDERYSAAIGRSVRLPLMDREIPVVGDDVVDPEFGTGAVKVTPAHDAIDFEIAERAGLEPLVVIDTEARITDAGGRFAGADRYEAREAVRHALEEEGYLVEVETHLHSVGHCSRCGTVVEPLLSLQWFVKVAPLVGPAMEAVRDGSVRFVPKRWENNYFRWMENLRDWTISRQLWWGHRIPAWYCEDCDEVVVARAEPVECSSCGGAVRPDEDVLDTWFSSALWPFSTLGWPEQTDDLEKFYPTNVLVTGYDIISFWVARMMKMGLHFAGEAPFSDTVIHGLVRAADGQKMSKTTGNALDPLDLVREYGADAVRLALLQSAAPGHDIPFDEAWVDAARRFGNKLWNAARFVVEHTGVGDVPAEGGYPEEPGPEDAWILSRLAAVTAEYDRLSDDYRYSDAVGLLYNFAWSDVFDWYLEMAKTSLQAADRAAGTRQTLGVVLRDLLKLFHPVIPFLTEELWAFFGDNSLLISAPWPEPPEVRGPDSFDALRDLVIGVRRFRSDHQLSPRRELILLLDGAAEGAEPWWVEQVSALAAVEVRRDGAPSSTAGHARVGAGELQAFIPLADVIDVDAERPRLEKEIADTAATADKAQHKLDNRDFREKAPAAVVAKEQAKLEELESTLAKLTAQLAELG